MHYVFFVSDVGMASVLAIPHSMDMFLNPNENDLDQLQNLGNIPMNNNFGKTETYLKQKLGSIPNLNYPDPIAPSSSPEG